MLAWARIDHRFPGDDALITLTFAKNLARGDGFVFNAPPPVLGSTTPLLVVALAAVKQLLPTTPMTAIAVAISTGC